MTTSGPGPDQVVTSAEPLSVDDEEDEPETLDAARSGPGRDQVVTRSRPGQDSKRDILLFQSSKTRVRERGGFQETALTNEQKKALLAENRRRLAQMVADNDHQPLVVAGVADA